MGEAVGRLAQLRQRVLDEFGRRGVHAIEDGAVVGIVLGLWVTFEPAAIGLLLALGTAPKRAGLVAILAELRDLVREEQARAQESYFVGAAIAGVPIGLVAGVALSMAAAHSGVDVPPVADLLALVG